MHFKEIYSLSFEEIYSFKAIDAVEEGKQVYVLDRKTKEVIYVNGMEVFALCEIIKSTEKNRYVFWVEEKESKTE